MAWAKSEGSHIKTDPTAIQRTGARTHLFFFFFFRCHDHACCSSFFFVCVYYYLHIACFNALPLCCFLLFLSFSFCKCVRRYLPFFSRIKSLIDWLINRTVLIRDDYKECADNTLVLLNAVSQHNATIRKPVTVHLARWMSQVLYCQKMNMWSQQMSYDDILIAKLRRINLFLALFYVQAWLSSSIGSNAAVNDFFWKTTSQYEKFDSAVAQAASKQLAKHRWYLEEETVVYVLFSSHPAISLPMETNVKWHNVTIWLFLYGFVLNALSTKRF